MVAACVLVSALVACSVQVPFGSLSGHLVLCICGWLGRLRCFAGSGVPHCLSGVVPSDFAGFLHLFQVDGGVGMQAGVGHQLILWVSFQCFGPGVSQIGRAHV